MATTDLCRPLVERVNASLTGLLMRRIVSIGTKVDNLDMLRYGKGKAFVRKSGIEPNILQRIEGPRFVHVDVLDAADAPIRVIDPHFERFQVFGNAGFRRELQTVRSTGHPPHCHRRVPRENSWEVRRGIFRGKMNPEFLCTNR